MWMEKVLLKRKLASNDAVSRLEAVAALDAVADGAILLALAAEDVDPEVRTAAIVRVDDPEALDVLRTHETDQAVLRVLARRINGLYGEQALAACAEGRECDAFDHIGDAETLIAVALRSDSPNLVLAAGARLIAQPERWLSLIEQLDNDALALELYRRNLPEPDSAVAERLACYARSRGLRDAIAEERARRQAAAQTRAAELALVEAAEACALEPDAARFDELVRRWNALGSENEALKTRFLAAKYRHCQALESRLASRQALEREYELAARLTGELEKLPQIGSGKAFQSLMAAWESGRLDAAPGAAEFKTRFHELAAAWENHYREARRATDEALAGLRRILADFQQMTSEPEVPEVARRKVLLDELSRLEASMTECSVEWVEGKERILGMERDFRRRARAESQERDLARWEHYTLKMDLCAELEKLSAVGDAALPEAAKQFRLLREKWMAIGVVPQEKFAELHKRYRNACSALHARLETFFAARDAARQNAETAKLGICEEAESLSASEDWEKTSARLKELQAAWKSVGVAAPGRERELFARFHAACDAFFVRRNTVWEERKNGFLAAAARKRELCDAAEALKDQPFFKAKNEIAALREAWRAVPSAGRDDRLLYMEFNRIIESIFAAHREAGDEARRRSEIVCTALLELLEKARSGELPLEAIEAGLNENRRQWENLGMRPAADAAHRREQALAELSRILEKLHHQEARHRLDSAEQLEAVVETEENQDQLIDHLGRRLKVCGELEERLRECRIIAGGGDLASELEKAIAGNFGGAARELTVAELDEFLQRFVAVGRVPAEAREAVFDRFRTLYSRALEDLSHRAEKETR